MKLIVGLGNPGDKYQFTRHNIGFLVMDKFAEELDAHFSFHHDLEGLIAETHLAGDKIKLLKPQTYMNESGQAVGKTKNFWKIDEEDIIIIHDDVDLELGKVRVQLGGSSAGHKGVQSVLEHIGDNFWRIRIGIGKSDTIPTDKWVLQEFEDIIKVLEMVDKIAKKVLEFLHTEIREETIIIN